MTNIYNQHAAAFAQTSAYVVLKDGERVATLAFKFPRDGAGRLYAYVHWLGLEMVRGQASGGGYDKRSAACSAAVKPMKSKDGGWHAPVSDPMKIGPVCDFLNALAPDDGMTWETRLRDAGFTVLQAV